jgi:hypothetical protein
MLESEPESPVEKNFPQPKIGSKRSDLGSYPTEIISAYRSYQHQADI